MRVLGQEQSDNRQPDTDAPPSTLTCPNGQHVVLVSVTYTNVAVSGGGDSESISGDQAPSRRCYALPPGSAQPPGLIGDMPNKTAHALRGRASQQPQEATSTDLAAEVAAASPSSSCQDSPWRHPHQTASTKQQSNPFRASRGHRRSVYRRAAVDRPTVRKGCSRLGSARS